MVIKEKYKYLLKNVGLLTISNFGTKILSFILIPLYTSILTTAEYGTYDVYATTVSLLIPLLTMNIIDGVMRFSLDVKKEKRKVFSIGLKTILIAILIFTILVLINKFFHIITIFEEFYLYLIVLFGFELIYSILSQFSRGVEKVFDLAVAGAINSATILLSNVFLLVFLKIGLKGYFFANILGYIIPSIYLIFRLKIWNFINLKNNDKELENEMFTYTKPLVFNTISWWITNVSDRYIITWICGVAVNGIYSVAYKIPSILNIFQNIFSQAWTLSAVKEYEKESSEFYSQIYKIYNFGMVIICSGLLLFDKVLAKILFAKDFYLAWKYAPFLMISVVFGSLSGMLGGIFSAAKKSKVFAQTTVIGAVINLILNIIFVHFVGAVGAAIATLVSYVIVWERRLIEANKIVKLDIRINRDIISYILLLAQAIVLYVDKSMLYTYIIEIIIVIIIILLYFNDFYKIIKNNLKGVRNKWKN